MYLGSVKSLLIVLGLGVVFLGCEEKPKKKDAGAAPPKAEDAKVDDEKDEKPAKDKKKKVPPASGSGGSGGRSDPDPCTPTSGSGDDTASTDQAATGAASSTATSSATSRSTSRGLSLQDQASWTNVKSILANKCGGAVCHTSAIPPLVGDADMVKAAESDIRTRIDADDATKMPPQTAPAGPLTAAEKQSIIAWFDAGAPTSGGAGTATATNTDTDDGGTSGSDDDAAPGSGSAGSDCDTGDASEGDGASSDEILKSAIDELLNPPAMQECKADGKLYDRLLKACSTAEVATSYACTKDGIISKFKSVSVDVTATIAQYEAKGYTIDQCGELGADPLVLFVRQDTSNPSEARIGAAKLCRKGSPICGGN